MKPGVCTAAVTEPSLQSINAGNTVGRRSGLKRSCTAGMLALMVFLAPPSVSETPPAGEPRLVPVGEPRLDRLDHLGVEDGLSHSTVWYVHQDARGFMWFATTAALNRYDGYEVVVYEHDPEDTDSLSSSRIYTIFETLDGLLWFGTPDGLNRFDPVQERFTHYRHDPGNPESLASDQVWSMLEASSGTFWIGTSAGLERFDRQTETFQCYRHDPDDPNSLGPGDVDGLVEDASGRLWVGTSEGGLHRLDPGSEAFVHYRHDPRDDESLSNDAIKTLLFDREGDLWVGSHGAIDRFDPETERFERFPLDPSDPRSATSIAESFHEDSNGDVWVAWHGSGLSRFDRGSQTLTHFERDPENPSGLSSDDLLDLHEDQTGVLWIASRSGLDIYDRQREQFVTFHQKTSRPDRLGGNRVRTVIEDRDGILWAGTADGGLTGVDRSSGTATIFSSEPGNSNSLPSSGINVVIEDRDGSLWIGTRDGLSHLSRDRRRFSNYTHDPQDPTSIPNDYIAALLIDAAGKLWISTQHEVVRLERDPERFVPYRHDPSDPHSLSTDGLYDIYGLYEDRDETLWVGTNQGLNRFDAAQDRFTRYQHDPANRNSLSNNQIRSFYQDSARVFWIGTIGGLNRWDSERGEFRHYRKAQGLPSDIVNGILEDDRGHLWIATLKGLSRFDPVAETFTNYGPEDGLHGAIFSFDGGYRSPDGEMFFCGLDGVSAFFPDQIRKDPHPPRIVLTDFRLLNHPVPLNRRDPSSPLRESITTARDLVLAHHHKIVAFEFAALHYANPDQNRYAYRLSGFDEDWNETGADQRFAQYTNLDAGHYDFQVKASNKDGVWSTENVSLRLTVLPPPWKTWWAYTLYGLALVGILVGYVLWQKRRLERERAINTRLREVDRLKDEFLANTSHELRTPLYGIVGIAESLIDGAAGQIAEPVQSNLGMIVSSGKRLSGLVNDILDFSKMSRKGLELKKKAVDLKALTDVVLTLSRPLLDGKDLQLSNAIAPDLPAAEADENRLQQILLNLVSNAIKFTSSGQVDVSAVAEEGRLIVTVSDTGIGIAEDRQEQIFESFEQADASTEREFGGTGLGLAVTKELVSLHGGSLWVESTPGEGSRFYFTLPISDHDLGTAVSEPTAEAEPLHRPQVPVATTEERQPETAGHEDLTDEGACRILIVDDEPVIRQVLVNHLAASEFHASQAPGGEVALRRVQEEPFDLVLLDIMMPRMSGYEVCRRIRESHPPQDLPILFLTAKDQVADLLAGFEAGANDFLTKPISKSELLARVRTHLDLLFTHRSQERLVNELRTRNAELTRFNYTISHDLKNPLVTIRNFTGLLRRDAKGGHPERLNRDIDRIDAAAKKMQRLIEELLKLAQAGHRVHSPEAVPYRDLVREALDQLDEKITKTKATIDVADELPTVYGDRVQLAEVVENLLDNALKYVDDRKPPRVSLGVRHTGAEEIFYVRDNGRGVDPRYHDKIFGLFERLDPDEQDGTGLGLALVQQIIESHGGRVWVESEGVGQGSEFCFTLPPPPPTPH